MTEHIHSHNSKESVARLFLIIAAIIGASLLTGYFNALLVLSAIVLMVMIHELGHFLTAKWSGMMVTEYFLGFGPKLWSFKRGETEYGIKAIPAGGYVKIVGMSNLETVDASNESRTYRQQPYWQKLMVASAGSIMHFVMAFLLLMVLYSGFGGMLQPKVDELSTLQNMESPAAAAGLQSGDVINSINGEPTKTWTDVQRLVRANGGQEVTLDVRRGDQSLQLTTTLTERSQIKTSEGESLTGSGGFLGASPADAYVRSSIPDAVVMSGKDIGTGFQTVVSTLVDRFSPSGIASIARQVADARENGNARAQADANNQPAPETETSQDDARLISPLGLANFSEQTAEAGIRTVLVFLFSVNLFVGIFNLVPLLPFDGGHIAIATYEKLRSLRGKRHYADFAKLAPFSYAVLLVLVVMGVSALWLDIWYPARLFE